MADKREQALRLAGLGFYVFPITPGQKAPALITGWPDQATRNQTNINSWWEKWPAANIGIYTGKYKENQALIVVDEDNKDGKNGAASLFRLELEGVEIPPTLTTITPTGGKHYFLSTYNPVTSNAGILADGVDIRSAGGYVVAPGSECGGTFYQADLSVPVAEVPLSLVARLNPAEPPKKTPLGPKGVDTEKAAVRAKTYLLNAPTAELGQRNHEAFKVAAHVKDLGAEEATALELMEECWNPRCDPPLGTVELKAVVHSAYKYGREAMGSKAPEADFAPIDTTATTEPHAFKQINKEFAYVLAGGGDHIIWETRDYLNRPILDHLALSTFHNKYASWTLQIGKKREQVTKLWMISHERRSYDGLCFAPGTTPSPRFYNLWKGFAYEPCKDTAKAEPAAKNALRDYLFHIRDNICHGDDAHFKWVMAWAAHMFQKPGTKPQTAMVLKGDKGVGKNAFFDHLSALLGTHAMTTSNRRYLVGNFNVHLEKCLLIVLDEAFWSGDKQTEGILKDLITGKEHVIEPKNREVYKVANKTRVAILGNEDWLVPASENERRYAVFNVGNKKRQDVPFFKGIDEGMKQGGYELLLRYLLEFDISQTDINTAPQTKALHDQKTASLDVFHQWWLDCLSEERILGADFGEWPTGNVLKERIRDAFRRYCEQRRLKTWIPNAASFGRGLLKCVPPLVQTRIRAEGDLGYAYRFPSVRECRLHWEQFIGHECEWEVVEHEKEIEEK